MRLINPQLTPPDLDQTDRLGITGCKNAQNRERLEAIKAPVANGNADERWHYTGDRDTVDATGYVNSRYGGNNAAGQHDQHLDEIDFRLMDHIECQCKKAVERV
ncbi:hypothetical protein D3C87_1846270 [compost metagenome]